MRRAWVLVRQVWTARSLSRALYRRERAAARRSSVPVQPRLIVLSLGCLILTATILAPLHRKHDKNSASPVSLRPLRQAGAPVPWHAGTTTSEMISHLAAVAVADERVLMNNTASSYLHWLVNKLDNGDFALSDFILLHQDGVLRDDNVFPTSYSVPLDLSKLQALDSRSMRVELDRAIRGINLQCRRYFQEGKSREEIIRRIIALMLVRAQGFPIEFPESRYMETRKRFVFIYMIGHSQQLQQFPPRLNSSDYAAFLVDCAYDEVHGI